MLIQESLMGTAPSILMVNLVVGIKSGVAYDAVCTIIEWQQCLGGEEDPLLLLRIRET